MEMDAEQGHQPFPVTSITQFPTFAYDVLIVGELSVLVFTAMTGQQLHFPLSPDVAKEIGAKLMAPRVVLPGDNGQMVM